jgi:hypothetical protein
LEHSLVKIVGFCSISQNYNKKTLAQIMGKIARLTQK